MKFLTFRTIGGLVTVYSFLFIAVMCLYMFVTGIVSFVAWNNFYSEQLMAFFFRSSVVSSFLIGTFLVIYDHKGFFQALNDDD